MSRLACVHDDRDLFTVPFAQQRISDAAGEGVEVNRWRDSVPLQPWWGVESLTGTEADAVHAVGPSRAMRDRGG